jgi:hypothetical protein
MICNWPWRSTKPEAPPGPRRSPLLARIGLPAYFVHGPSGESHVAMPTAYSADCHSLPEKSNR